MSNLLVSGAAWLAGQLRSHASLGIVYVRGTQQVSLGATAGTTEFQIEDMGGLRIEHSDRDFILPVGSLVLGNVITEPRRGDRVLEGGLTYEVMAPGNVQPYRFDAHRQLLRVHTKRVS